ncbi:MAG: Hpt domain-containing protein [Deltaproteobacteria bacterium]|nr:Hpt domain-containing protein [Deltaproteobacteria bacterium]
MMDDIRQRFVPRFAELARGRIARGVEITKTKLRGQEALQLARELHSLAGEAGLLGFSSIIRLARQAEEAATELHAERSPERCDALGRALDELSIAIDVIEADASL